MTMKSLKKGQPQQVRVNKQIENTFLSLCCIFDFLLHLFTCCTMMHSCWLFFFTDYFSVVLLVVWLDVVVVVFIFILIDDKNIWFVVIVIVVDAVMIQHDIVCVLSLFFFSIWLSPHSQTIIIRRRSYPMVVASHD